jgi:uncharacterized protein (DUF885 family)
MGHQITLMLSDSVYEVLRYQAQKKSVKQVAEETLQAATLPEKSLQRSLEADLQALAEKSDAALWHIAASQLPPAKMRRWQRLIAKHEAGDTLTPDEAHSLDRLIEEGERLTTLKSEAYALLQWRGHCLPTLEELWERR